MGLNLCLLAACGLWLSTAATENANAVALGGQVEDLGFKDIRFLPRHLSELGEPKCYVLVSVANTWPDAEPRLAALKELDAKFRDQAVQFVAVNSVADDSIREMAAMAVEAEVPFPFVKDVDGSCARQLGLTRLGESVVLDGDRKLRFRGDLSGIDAAVADLLAGRQVAQPSVAAKGPPIPIGESLSIDHAVTYAEHIAPLLKKHCQECHRDGTEAPFSLTRYEDAASHGEMIAEVVSEERMPPWYASGRHGEFANQRVLTARERALVEHWVKTGAEVGDLATAPEPWPPAESKWTYGEPDLILKVPQKHKLPADGYIPYKYVILPHIFLKDTWVQWVEILPDNPRVVHHCNMAYARAGNNYGREQFVTGRVPGVQPMNLSDGIAYLIPAGSVLALQIHYTTTGKEEECQISVGIRYAKETVQKRFRFGWMVDEKFAIPPGDFAHKVSGIFELDTDAIGFGLFSHMHLRGRDMTFIAHYPDGNSEKLLLIPNYNFGWQLGYQWADSGRKFPRGTRLEAVAHFDNSQFNPYNPDPNTTVREGPQTFEEMLNGVFFYIDEHEQLNLRIDPRTGQVIEKEAKG